MLNKLLLLDVLEFLRLELRLYAFYEFGFLQQEALSQRPSLFASLFCPSRHSASIGRRRFAAGHLKLAMTEENKTQTYTKGGAVQHHCS